jgi:hypothetical protein
MHGASGCGGKHRQGPQYIVLPSLQKVNQKASSKQGGLIMTGEKRVVRQQKYQPQNDIKRLKMIG